MDKILAVARREFLTTVRTKAFVLSVLLMPVIIVGSIYGTQWAMARSKDEKLDTRRIALLDRTSLASAEFATQIGIWNAERPNQPLDLEVAPADADPNALRTRVGKSELYAFILLEPNAITALTSDPVGEIARRDDQLDMGRRLGDMVNKAVANVRIRATGLAPEELALLQRPVTLQQVNARTGEAKRVNEMARILTPFAFMFLLFTGTFGIAQGLLTSLIEEKGSRIVEVLLSAVSPTQLMAGKILGMVLVGLLLMTVWGGSAYAAAQKYQAADLVTSQRLIVALLYFLPGFLLMAAILAAIGSACNELKDAQSMVFPISILTIIPMVFWFYIAENPASPLSLGLSFIPVITPFVMILRVCADPDTPVWQIAATLGVLWVSVLVAFWASGKIFRVGVLMYGKPPSLRELLRWVRYT